MKHDLLNISLALLERFLTLRLVHRMHENLLITFLGLRSKRSEVITFRVPGHLMDVVLQTIYYYADSGQVVTRSYGWESPS